MFPLHLQAHTSPSFQDATYSNEEATRKAYKYSPVQEIFCIFSPITAILFSYWKQSSLLRRKSGLTEQMCIIPESRTCVRAALPRRGVPNLPHLLSNVHFLTYEINVVYFPSLNMNSFQ